MIRKNTLWSTGLFWKVISLFSAYGVTAGAHRLWSHRSYKANSIAQIILMIFFSFTYQNSIYIWCRDHRLHHKYSETDADPHNAKRGFFFSHMGWLLVRKHKDVIEKGRSVDVSDLEANPLVMLQHRYRYVVVPFFSVVFTTFVPWYFFGESLENSIFVATLYRYVTTYHATWSINSFAHLFGYKPYDARIGPTENTCMTIVTFGEGFHNYHHTFPSDYRASEFSSDPTNSTKTFIDIFAYFGWVTDRKTVPQELVEKRIARTGDTRIRKVTNYLRDIAGIVFYLYMV